MIKVVVIDASVGIKLFIEEEGSDQAERLFNQLAEPSQAQFYVPDLFFIECANILWKYVHRYNYPPENARQDVTDLQALALHTISTADLLPMTLDLALTHDISAYDACYAALAQLIKLPLITADNRLVRKLFESKVVVHPLEEMG